MSNHTTSTSYSSCDGSWGQSSYVTAKKIGQIYGISPRYVLKMAAEGRIPRLVLGRKCIRFEPSEVAAAMAKNIAGRDESHHEGATK